MIYLECLADRKSIMVFHAELGDFFFFKQTLFLCFPKIFLKSTQITTTDINSYKLQCKSFFIFFYIGQLHIFTNIYTCQFSWCIIFVWLQLWRLQAQIGSDHSHHKVCMESRETREPGQGRVSRSLQRAIMWTWELPSPQITNQPSSHWWGLMTDKTTRLSQKCA